MKHGVTSKTSPKHRDRRERAIATSPLIMLALAAIAFGAFLGYGDVSVAFESRLVQPAREQAAAGWPWNSKRLNVTLELPKVDTDAETTTREVNPWLVPVITGYPRLQKPPLPGWTIAVLIRLFGYGEAIVRAPSAIFGAISLLLIYRLATDLSGRATGWAAMLVWVSSYFVCTEFRKAMVDPFLAFFTLVAVCTWIAADLRCARDRRWRWLALLAYAAVGAGAMCKGPVILVHVVVAILAFHLTQKRRPRVGILVHLLGIAVIVALALPWPAMVALRVPGAIDLWRAESIGNLAEQTRNARPLWTYLPMVFQISLPWTLPWLFSTWRDIRHVRRATARAKAAAIANLFPLLWLVGVVVFFSFAHMKKPAYLLPVMPAIVLPAARGIVLLIRAALRPGGQVSRWIIGGHAVAGAAFAIGASVAVNQELDSRTLGMLVGASLILAGVLPLFMLSLGRLRWWLSAQAFAFCVAASLGIALRHAAMDRASSSRKLDSLVMRMISADPDLTLLDTRLPPEAAVYLPADIRRDPTRSRVLMIYDPDGEVRRPGSAALVRVLPFKVADVRRIPVDESVTKRWELWAFTTESPATKP